jgi:predicted nucleic acid-binding protein
MRRVFVDTDVILDLATGREPFVRDSHNVLAVLERGRASGFVSSNVITYVYYILRKLGSDEKARIFIQALLSYLFIVPVDHQNVLQALDSPFKDFEDAVQHFSARTNQCDCIVTRNLDGYTNSGITVLDPKGFLALFMQ